MPKSKPLHILVIRLSAMGDVAMTVPVLLALVQTYPQLRLTVLSRGFFAPLFEPLDRVSFFTADLKGRHKGLGGLWTLYRELRAQRFDAVADLHNVLRSNILKVFFSFHCLPFAQLHKGRTEKRALTAMKNKDFRPLRATHLRYADVFEKLGYPLNLEAVQLPGNQPMTAKTQELLGNNPGKRIGIAPFAAYAGKRYPLERMEVVLEELSKTEGYTIILFGGGREERDQLAQWASSYTRCINAAGVLPFKEELALISNLDLMVSMDSGNAHLAANFRIPTITLWGLTHPFAGFYPFGQESSNALLADRSRFPGIPTSVFGKKMPKGYENVMESISPADVVRKIKEVLGEK